MILKKRRPPAGASPGTLVTNPKSRAPEIHVMQFSADSLVEESPKSPADIKKFLSDKTITWVDVHGLGDADTLRELAAIFSIHPLALEDVVHVPQRPKTEVYDHHVFLIARMGYMERAHDADVEQLSLFIGKNYVLTFQDRHTGTLDPVRTRIRSGKGPIRKQGADYVGYAIIDTVIDQYYPIMEDLGDELESIEHQTVEHPNHETLQRIYTMKRELLEVRRAVWPQRDAINALIREDTPFISEPVKVYLRDCYDHIIQLMDVVDTCRELASNLMDIYLSTLSHRMNEVMKVLTIIATIFIPITFIVGVYGMNFEFMPELQWSWGYPAILGICAAIAVGMLFFFRRLGWLRRDET